MIVSGTKAGLQHDLRLHSLRTADRVLGHALHRGLSRAYVRIRSQVRNYSKSWERVTAQKLVAIVTPRGGSDPVPTSRRGGRTGPYFDRTCSRSTALTLPPNTSELSRIHTFVEFDTPRYSAIFRDISRSSAISRDLAISQDITILCYLALFCDLAIPSARLRLNTMAR